MKRMRKKIISIVLTACMLLSLMPPYSQTAAAASWLDDGTTDTSWYTGHESDNSYTITTPEALAGFANLVNGGNSFSGKTVALGADIILNWVIDYRSKLWTPIGSSSHPFQGSFDGSGYTVSGMYIHMNDDNTNQYNQGLFGYVSGGEIKNVGMVKGSIGMGAGTTYMEDRENIGGLVGYIENGTIINCYNAGIVKGLGFNCLFFGGLVGRCKNSTITNCYNTGSISNAGSTSGGLAGRSDSSTITSCYNTGSVTGAGGLNENIGGLVGVSYGTGAITNCYNAGSINTNRSKYIGGLVGDNQGTITNCYSTGSVNGSENTYVGGIAGTGTGTVTGCYYDKQTSGISGGINGGDTAGAAVGKTTAWMKNATSTAGIDGDSDTFAGWDTEIWGFISNKYPQLRINLSVWKVSTEGTEAPINGNLVITFSKSINTTAGGTVSLSDGSTPAELSGGSWSENNRVYTVAYSGLAYETKYTVSISGFTDTEGETMTDDSANSFTTKPIPRIKLSQTDQYTFSDQIVGYSSVSPLTVTVSNIGSLATGDLTVTMSGNGKNSFTLSKTTISTIALSGTDTFTLEPKTGLGVGTYSMTVTVSGDSMASKSFTVRFTVNDGVWNGTSDTSWYTGHESDSTYTITTPEELAGVASLVNNGNGFSGKTITLGASIALNKVSEVNSWNTKAPDHSWTPIGSSSHSFKGSFDGCGYTVSGVYINTTTRNQGLFGYVSGGKIKNTGVINSYISGSICDGNLVGYIENSTISNCYTTGMVTCVSSDSSFVGGVAGRSVSSTITSCYNTGSISTQSTLSNTSNVGGLIGSIDSSTITSCYNTGNITGSVGWYDCSNNAGGLIGGSYESSAITNCYNLGNVADSSDAPNTGGLVGDNRCIITNCYNTGSVSGNGNKVGGIAGYSSGTVTGCYYDKETSRISGGISGGDSAGAAVGKTTVWMKNSTSTAGIDGDTDTFAGWDTDWSFAPSKYPQLRNTMYVLRVSPGGTEKAISGNLVITFSKTMDTMAGGTVSLSDGSTLTGLSSGSWSKNDTVYTVAYSGLAYETEYTVKISGFTDTEGETMSENDVNSFKTTSRIRLSQTDPYIFTERILDYSAVSPLMVIVSNTSNQVTGNLTVALSGTGKNSFTLSKTTISGIALGGTDTFNVVPKTGLGEGTYSTTVTVSWNNLVSKSFTVQFTVRTNIWDGTSNVSWYTGHESDSSYTINTPAELAGLASLVNSEHNFSGKTVKLGANILLNDVSGVSGWSTSAPDNSWTPIGNGSYTYDSNYNVTYDDTFNGVFDGCGYTVSGIYINKTTGFQGLFGNINGGTIKNVGVVDSYISGDLYDGGLVGYIQNGTITNSYNMVSITGSKYVGGLAGRVINSTIIRSHNTGSVTCSGQYDGGLAGDIANSTIANCYNTGSVISSSQCVGGLFGQSASSTITNCYNMGDTGLANSAAVGGLVGSSNEDIITNCYNTSRVSGAGFVGGIAGYSGSTVTGCYYDKQTSGISGGINGSDTAGAAVGKTTAWMKNATATAGISGDADTFAGWDTAVWSFASAKYPQLKTVPYGISLSQTGLYTFPDQSVGYSSVPPLTVTVSNIGSLATGDLTVTLSGTRKDSFTLSKTTISSIAEGNTDNLTIVPNSNLSEGTYTATVTISGSNVTTQTFKLSFEITAAPTVQEIFITTPATKLTYTVGDRLDISGMVVMGYYSDQSVKEESITIANITGFDSSTPAVDQVLTVEVGGKTTTYTVTINAAPAATLQSISITAPANKLVYTVGDSLDISGMVVTGTYSDNSSKTETITTANITGFDSSAPAVDQVLTVEVGGKTTTYTVTINAVPAATLQSIAITAPANKLVYTVGDSLDISGMVVTGTYSDNSSKTETITTSNIIGFDSSAPAVNQVLTVTVGGKTTTYTVTINAVPAATLQGIAITTPAAKLTYTVGESLDISGMVVTGTYSDNSSKTETITTANIIGFDSSAPAVNQVLTVTVGGNTTTYTVTINAVPAATLQGIAITTPAAKLTYTVGESLDISGMVVTGTYSDNSSKTETITTANIIGFDSSAPAVDQVLTVMVGGKTTTYTVTINAAPVVDIDASISPLNVTYDLNVPANVVTTITWNSASMVTGVVYGTTSLIKPDDYVVSGSALTIKSSYINTLGVSEGDAVTFRISFDKGNDRTLTINVVGSNSPVEPAVHNITLLSGGNGTVSANIYSAAKDTQVILTAAPNSGYHIKEWQVVEGVVTITDNKFTMPDSNVTVKAIFEQIPATTYQVTINGSYSAESGAGSYSSGDTVSINAGSRSNYTFNGWTSANGIIFANANSAATTFIMPTGNVALTAFWSYSGSSGSSAKSTGSSNADDSDTTEVQHATKPGQPTIGTAAVKVMHGADYSATAKISEKTIADAIAKTQAAIKEKTENGIGVSLSIDSPAGTKALGIVLTQPTLTQLTKAEAASFEIDGSLGSLNFDLEAIKEIRKQSTGDVTINITPVTGLDGDAKTFVGTRPVYDISISYVKDGKSIDITTLGSGSVTLSLPYTPGKDEAVGYLFGVYVDGKGNVTRIEGSTYDANSRSIIFDSNHFSVYGVGYAAPGEKFKDISAHWAKESIDYVVGRNLLSGATATTFSPDSAMGRGMLVTALGRLAGVDVSNYKTVSFTDVAADKYYAPYIEWAYKKGIIQGTGNGKFGPDRTVTREQIAVLFANYAKATGYALPVTREASTYEDASSIGSTYKTAVTAMQQAGIMLGGTGNQFNPKSSATRAEVSSMLRNYIKLTINPATVRGWAANDDGQRLYYKDGKALTGWQTIKGEKFFFDTDGVLQTGWKKDDNGNWHYLSSKGLLVGWLDIGGGNSKKRYYFTGDAVMVSDKWLKIDKKWYYFNTDGSLAVSTKIDEYEVDENGVRVLK